MVSVRLSPLSTKQRDSAEPIRSTPPRASTRSSVISNRRYLKLVLPRFATRIFMASVSTFSREPRGSAASALARGSRLSVDLAPQDSLQHRLFLPPDARGAA